MMRSWYIITDLAPNSKPFSGASMNPAHAQ